MAQINLKKLVFGTTLTGLMMFFQNCGQQVSFKDSESSLKLTGERLILIDDGAVEGQAQLPLLQDESDLNEESDNAQSEDAGVLEQGNVVNNNSMPVIEQQESVTEVVVNQPNNSNTTEMPQSSDGQNQTVTNPIEMLTLPSRNNEEANNEQQEIVEVVRNENAMARQNNREVSSQHTTDNNVPVLDLSGENQHYLCVVAGKGKSTHIGMIEEVLTKNATPNSLCMSENACLNIMSQYFEVVEAKFTGFCKNNKAHTLRIADGDAIALVNQLSE